MREEKISKKIEENNIKNNSEYLFSEDKIFLSIILKYNIVKSYVFAINKLWAYQTSCRLCIAPCL